jgi:epoxyqueuosine reductase
MTSASAPWKKDLHRRAQDAGFADVRIAPARLEPFVREAYTNWLASGMHGEMEYLAKTKEIRLNIEKLLPGAQSVVVFRAEYYPFETPSSTKLPSDAVRVAKYALGRDYHFVLRNRLEPIVAWLESVFPGHRWRITVDSAPLIERAYAVASGIGFWGKNTMVITPRCGSYYFLACIVTTAHLDPDPPLSGTCGTCTRCLDACPTGAIVAPYLLDARRCISYLTIEKRTPLTEDERHMLGNWIFGCDICQDVCPYNRYPRRTEISDFGAVVIPAQHISPRHFLKPSSNRQFAREFAASPLLRAGRRRIKELALWFLEKFSSSRSSNGDS